MLDSLTLTQTISGATVLFSEINEPVYWTIGVIVLMGLLRFVPRLVKKAVR